MHKIHTLRSILLTLLLLVLISPGFAGTLTFGVVPQQSASKLARIWGPMLAHIHSQTGIAIRFKTAPDIPTFERRVARGEYDLSYMNPYHYTVFSRQPGYRALARARNKRIKGIIVTRKDSPYRDISGLAGENLAFPSPAAFAASILTQAAFSRSDIPVTPKYVSSHDSVYRNIAKGIYPAGGGVVRTFKAVAPEVREQLRILMTTKGYTPHAVAAHPRVPSDTVKNIQAALLELEQSEMGRQLLAPLKIEGWQAAEDSDWDDVRALDIHLLDDLAND